MKLKIVRVLAPLACVALVACNNIPGMGKSSKAPSGQVIATIDGEEITLAELRAELAGAPAPPTPQVGKAMQEQALKQILVRKLLAHAAKEQGLDKTPDFAVQRERATETLLAQAVQRKLAVGQSVSTRQEGETFVAEHPGMFAQRKLLTVDQIRMGRPKNEEDLKGLQPLKSLGDIEAYLQKKGIEYQRGASVIDTASTEPAMIAQLEKLPPGEPFIVPQGGVILINQIRDSRLAPFTGEPAVNYALGILRNQKLQETVNLGVKNLVTSKASAIKYNDAYKPARPLGAPDPKPAGAPPAAAPAVPAAAPAATKP